MLHAALPTINSQEYSEVMGVDLMESSRVQPPVYRPDVRSHSQTVWYHSSRCAEALR